MYPNIRNKGPGAHPEGMIPEFIVSDEAFSLEFYAKLDDVRGVFDKGQLEIYCNYGRSEALL